MEHKFTSEDFQNGQLLLLDKPLRWTSFQVVNKVRWLIKRQYGFKKLKVGHAGTLDPLATGLLLIAVGRKYTKRIQEFQGLEKVYTGTFTFGATTPSYDLESEINETFPIDHLDKNRLKMGKELFLGEIKQYPPIFSALKKDGKRLYDYARKGEAVRPDPRWVHVYDFELTRVALPEVDFRVVCGKGTYIRSLARDFGRAVDSGAHLSALRRQRIGNYSVENAFSLEGFRRQISK